MQQSQIVTYGIDGSLAETLREFAQERRIWLRETNQFAACQSLVGSCLPQIFILLLGHELERELALLDQVHAALPGTAVIVVGETDNPTLAGLAWDLGATYVLFPPTPIELINEVITRCLEDSAA
jgi:DNA-binding NtrC family response regulator